MAITRLPDEDVLLARVAEGDEQAFARLFHAYYRPLADYVLRLTDSLDIAEEVVQDTFIKIWVRRDELPAITNLPDYLFILSRNQALNHLRQRSRERIRQMEWANALATAVDGEDLAGTYRDIIAKAVAQLPPQQQKVYRMGKQQRLKYEEIAKELGLSVETVKKHMKLALKNIKAYAVRYMDTPILLVLLHFFWRN